jgi:hypothetical protein
VGMSSVSGLAVDSNVVPVKNVTKEIAANIVFISAGVGVPQTVTPPTPQQSVSITNLTTNWIRATVVFDVAVIVAGLAATRVISIPPKLSKSVDLSGSTVAGELSAIASISIIATITPVATGEFGALAAALTASPGIVDVQWVSK